VTLRRLLGSICRLVYSAVPPRLRSTEGANGAIVSTLLGTLGLFESAYNRLAELHRRVVPRLQEGDRLGASRMATLEQLSQGWWRSLARLTPMLPISTTQTHGPSGRVSLRQYSCASSAFDAAGR
jgi:hypothetical protein